MVIPIAIVVLVAAVAASYAWYTRIKARRPSPELTWSERRRLMEQQLENRMREQGLIPLETVRNRSFRDRLPKIPMPSAADSIRNRRKRQQNLSIDDTSSVPFARLSQGGGLGTSTPRSPASVHTVASSDMQSLEVSPWISATPPCPISHAVTSSRGASNTRVLSASGRQPLSSTPFAPRPILVPQLPIISPLPRTVLANRPNRSFRSQETPVGSQGALSLPPLRVVRSETSHSLRFYRDEQMAIQQRQKESLSRKPSSALLVKHKNFFSEQ